MYTYNKYKGELTPFLWPDLTHHLPPATTEIRVSRVYLIQPSISSSRNIKDDHNKRTSRTTHPLPTTPSSATINSSTNPLTASIPTPAPTIDFLAPEIPSLMLVCYRQRIGIVTLSSPRQFLASIKGDFVDSKVILQDSRQIGYHVVQ